MPWHPGHSDLQGPVCPQTVAHKVSQHSHRMPVALLKHCSGQRRFWNISGIFLLGQRTPGPCLRNLVSK